ncbi:MAG: hypothetical protein L6V93_00925 [Clostridiales bacterium]|nr:MAG: hypothetical protein L6V93_00925 [Clostridiales bacterium]
MLTKKHFPRRKNSAEDAVRSAERQTTVYMQVHCRTAEKGTALFADSIGSVPGMDSDGPTSLINSVLKYNQYLAKSGFILNLKFNKELFGKDENIDKFISLAKKHIWKTADNSCLFWLFPQRNC